MCGKQTQPREHPHPHPAATTHTEPGQPSGRAGLNPSEAPPTPHARWARLNAPAPGGGGDSPLRPPALLEGCQWVQTLWKGF